MNREDVEPLNGIWGIWNRRLNLENLENLEMPDHIVASAVKLDGVVWQLPKPARHHHVLWALDQVLPGRAIEAHEQGFVTADGRYVDRLGGASLALAAGQVTELRWAPDLYSEDLW